MNIATIEVLAILAQRKSHLFEKIEELFYPNKKIAHKVQFSNIFHILHLFTEQDIDDDYNYCSQ